LGQIKGQPTVEKHRRFKPRRKLSEKLDMDETAYEHQDSHNQLEYIQYKDIANSHS